MYQVIKYNRSNIKFTLYFCKTIIKVYNPHSINNLITKELLIRILNLVDT